MATISDDGKYPPEGWSEAGTGMEAAEAWISQPIKDSEHTVSAKWVIGPYTGTAPVGTVLSTFRPWRTDDKGVVTEIAEGYWLKAGRKRLNVGDVLPMDTWLRLVPIKVKKHIL